MPDYPEVHIPGRDDDKQRKVMRSYLHPRSLMITDDQYQYIYDVGNGNYSEGVRACIEYHKHHSKPQ